MFRKSITGVIILLFLLSSIIAIASSNSSYETNKIYSIHVDENGTLSGYVKDTSMSPIEGAKIRVYFHETYEESYTDSSGYYNVTNIPICWCLKNATASKDGYTTEWVLLAIGENTTYDFVLTPLDTIYVDDDNTEGPWDGTQQHPYRYIQDGIDNANNGDTVFVYRGTYIENLRVNQSINLIGEDRDTTIIDGSEKDFPVWISTIIIRADSVNVRGFTILNEKVFSCGIFIGMNHNENVIVDNNIIFPWKGIWLSESRNNIIKENIISDAWDGIYLEGSEDNVITDNILFMNGISGISLNDANNNIITGNVIRKNIFGICCWNSIGNKISGNNIDSNEEFGIQIEYSFLNTISANNIINNTLDAYFLSFLSLQNRWDSNYWGKKYLIKPIFGEFWILFSNPDGGIESLRIPLVKFDKHPAQEPYDIPVPEVIT